MGGRGTKKKSVNKKPCSISVLTVFLVIQEWGPRDPRAFTNSFTASLSSVELHPIFIISLCVACVVL